MSIGTGVDPTSEERWGLPPVGVQRRNDEPRRVREGMKDDHGEQVSSPHEKSHRGCAADETAHCESPTPDRHMKCAEAEQRKCRQPATEHLSRGSAKNPTKRAAFGAAWLTVLHMAGVQLVGMSAMNAVWILSPALLPPIFSLLAPWSLSRIRHT
jgi:hypothetical protein